MTDLLRTMHANDLARIKPPDSVQDKANWSSDSRRELLKRMLDASLEDTIPTPGLMKAFEQPLTVEAFSSLITMDPTPLGDLDSDFDDAKYQKSHVFSLKPRENLTSEEMVDMQRAHRAMTILTADQPQLNMVLRTKPVEIIAPIFRAFRCPESKASIFHLCRVIDTMVKLNPEAVLTYLTGPRLKLCMQGLLSNLHCSVVVDTLFSLITIRCTMDNGLKPDTLKMYHKKLAQCNPAGVASGYLVAPESSAELKAGSSELLMRLLMYFDAVSLDPPNDADLGESFLFKSLANIGFLEKLAALAASSDDISSEAALTVFSSLCKLAAKGKLATAPPIMPVDDEDDKPKPAPTENKQAGKRRLKDFVPPPTPPVPKENRLTKLGNDVKSGLKPQTISAICGRALESPQPNASDLQPQKHTSYEVKQPFTYRRLEWLRALNYLLELDPQIPVPWKSLVSWQMQYPQNSMMQNEFAKALQTVLTSSASVDDCRPAIIDCKLVSHLVRRAKEHDTDHAHVVKCLNLLRLKSELVPKQHWLSQYLKSHSTWLEFLPELKRQTRLTLEPWLNELPSMANPVVGSTKIDSAAAALNALFLSDPDNPLNAVTRQISQEMVDQEKSLIVLDLEVGSRYAKSLGFNASQAVSGNETPGASAQTPSSVPGSSEKRKSGTKKKKKN